MAVATHEPLPPAPMPAGHSLTMQFSAEELAAEAQRLCTSIGQPDRWPLAMCEAIAPLTLEINALKQEKGAIILAHSYQTPDIVYGVADKVGDSYGLSKDAMETDAQTIVFSSVRFMAETAKLLNPQKTVLAPSPDAGCSLADGITPDQVLALKDKYPGVPVMCYVNTTADVKAVCDVCCTSANYLKIAENLPGDELIFVPDRFMGAHIKEHLQGKKTVHVFDAECEVHTRFDSQSARAWRDQASAQGRRLEILAHPECDPKVLMEADYIGSTEKMMDYARKLEAEGHVDVMPITECGTADRIRSEMPKLQVWGACVQCPHMKKTGLVDILRALQGPEPGQEIVLADQMLADARRCLDAMFDYAS